MSRGFTLNAIWFAWAGRFNVVNDHQPAMDSFPQELIDTIIDHLPDSDTHSSSLVAKRWRPRSQQHYFASVEFSCEDHIVRWCAKIPQDPDGIPSYVRSVRFLCIHHWREPALFGRVLKTFTSMTNLWIDETDIPQPDKVPGSVSFDEFGKEIKHLTLWSIRCPVATIVSMVLSFPNLEDFIATGLPSGEIPAILPHTPQRRPLASLRLYAPTCGIGPAMARCGLKSYRLSLCLSDAGLVQILTLSSRVVVELELYGMWSSRSIREQKRY